MTDPGGDDNRADIRHDAAARHLRHQPKPPSYRWDALRTTFGTLCDLEKPPGLLKTDDYNIQMTAPSGNMFCYGDSVPEFGFEPVMFWFARELRGYYLAAPTLDRLEPMRAILTSDGQMPDASRLQPIALIWWDPTLQPEPGKIVGPP